MPPAAATSILPSRISCATETMACAPEPQTRLTVIAGVVTGNPAWTPAWRAGFFFSPACTTFPMTTVSTSSGRIPARATAPPIAAAPSAGAGTSLRLPAKVPIAVRTGSAKTTERDVMAQSPRMLALRCGTARDQTPEPASDLRKSAVDEQFRTGDEARIVGCQEHDGLGDFLRSAKPPHRHDGGQHLQPLLPGLRRAHQL